MINKFYKHSKDLIHKIKNLKSEDKVIGFTNGCFDLLHKGHLKLIAESKNSCDFLIVALNSDNSIKRLKGIDRPYENEQMRIESIARLVDVDAIILFEEDTPLKLIKLFNPQYIFKGSDYSELSVVGSDYVKSYGGSIKIIELMPGVSTTKIINEKNNG